MAANPTCEVQDGASAFASSAGGVNVTPGNTVTIRLADQADVTSWLIECATTDDTSSASAVTASLSIDPIAKTASFTAPAAGKAYRFRSRVNGGIDVNGVAQTSYTTTFCVYTLTGGRRVIAADETTEGDATFGWIKWINSFIRTPGPGSDSYHAYIPALASVETSSATPQTVYAWSIKDEAVTSIVVDCNAVPSGGAAGGSYQRRARIWANNGVATMGLGGPTQMTWTDEVTGPGFTGIGVGSGVMIGHSGMTGFVNVKGTPTGRIRFGVDIVRRETGWA